MIAIYLKLYYLLFILLIYFDEEFPLFIPSEEEFLVQPMWTSLHEKNDNRMTSVGSNFLCGILHGADPPFTCVHLSLTFPLRVDIINGWLLIVCVVDMIILSRGVVGCGRRRRWTASVYSFWQGGCVHPVLLSKSMWHIYNVSHIYLLVWRIES